MVMLVLLLLHCCFLGCGTVFVRVLVRLVGWMGICVVRMRMQMLMLVRVHQIAVTMLMGVLVRMLMHVRLGRFEFVVFHACLL
jgi:hypothetical protein